MYIKFEVQGKTYRSKNLIVQFAMMSEPLIIIVLKVIYIFEMFKMCLYHKVKLNSVELIKVVRALRTNFPFFFFKFRYYIFFINFLLFSIKKE